MRKFTIIAILCLGASLSIENIAFAIQTVSLGPGSYSTQRPESCKPLPEEIFKVDSFEGPTPTNQWYSSLVWDKFSNNFFPHPFGAVACEKGFSMSYPGIGLVGAESAIMGGGISSNGDVVIGLDEVKFDDARLASVSSWFVTAQFSSDSGNLKTTFGHGSPFVFCNKDKGVFRLYFADKPVLWSGGEDSNTVGITVRGSHYGIFGSESSRWSIADDSSIVLESDEDYLTVALLPDNEISTLESFEECAHNHVGGSEFRYEIDKGELVTTWEIKTESKVTGESGPTMTALYPHQWKYSKDELTGQSYRSVRGEMKLLSGNSFQTRVLIQSVLPMLPAEGIPDRERMTKSLAFEVSKKPPAYGDTYWEGKHLGRMASLSGICEAMGDTERQAYFIDQLKLRLEDWFTATEGETDPLFYYNKNWGTLIGARPSYGSDEQLNDHHFHYGYFIRAAAEVARVDKAWAKKWAPMIELVIQDIAAPTANEQFPQLRGFDPYAGHSWASGHARFGDGNNQESSSESMNAWYGMMMWGQATGDEKIRDLGAFLFNTERTALEEYWMDVEGTNFPDKYPNVAVGMVWGGKGAFATWFSGDIDHIHGINWLPLTPASVYLGRFPDYVKANHAAVVKGRKSGADFNKGWGDLVVMFGALADSKPAVEYIDANPECNIEGGNSHAFMYHWIHTLNQFGQNDASITADYLFANVFVKDGKRTYIVYNFDDQPMTVQFSDGKEIKADKKGMFIVTASSE